MEKALGGASLNYSVITGYIPIDWYFPESEKTGLFYELVTKEGQSLATIKDSTNLVLWFNGGPGSSSQIGSFAEFGPFEVDSNGKLQKRPSNWN